MVLVPIRPVQVQVLVVVLVLLPVLVKVTKELGGCVYAFTLRNTHALRVRLPYARQVALGF